MEKEKSICFSLKRVNHIVERGIHTSLAAAGFDEITNMHGWILGFLYHAQRPVYQKDIESNFGIARSTVTNILQLMEKKGYLTRRRDERDRRVVRLTPTELGRKASEGYAAFRKKVAESAVACLTEDEAAAFARAVDKLSQVLYRSVEEKTKMEGYI